MRKTILLYILLSPFGLYAQDTLSIYFDLNSSKLRESEFDKLNSIPSRFDLSNTDSIAFIGMADSLGNFDANTILSEKRAKATYQYCKRLLPKNLSYRTLALGESTSRVGEKNRRVDIVFYTPGQFMDSFIRPDTSESATFCYYIDYDLLHRIHVRTITTRGKQNVIIERQTPDNSKPFDTLYQGSLDKNGIFVARRLKWKSKVTGKAWWIRTRYSVTIPKADYDRFRIFKIKPGPCTDCDEAFDREPKITEQAKCEEIDYFLMHNLQVSPIFLNRREVYIRVPREYVLDNATYHIGCNKSDELEWEEKNFGKKKRYYYSRLPIYELSWLANITREMECCEATPERTACNEHLIGNPINCGTNFPPGIRFLGEAGSSYQQSHLIPYFALGVSGSEEMGAVFASIGTNSHLDIFGSFRYNYFFHNFSLTSLSPVRVWTSPGGGRLNRFVVPYIGTETKIQLNQDALYKSSYNVHAGVARFSHNSRLAYAIIFLHGGLSADYQSIRNMSIYPFAQVGVNVNLGHR